MEYTASRRVTVLTVLLLFALAAAPGLVAAQETRAGSTITVGSGETVDGLDVAAATVVVHGTVNGDLNGVAADVRISQSGTVTGDVNVAAASLSIDGTVRGDVSAGVATFELGPGATVGGAVNIGAADATFAGQVDGDVVVGADTIVLTDSAAIGGDLRYDGQLRQASDASVAGSVVRDDSLGETEFGFSPVPEDVAAVYGLLANFVLGAVLLIAFPGTSRAIARTVVEEPVRSGGFGLLVLIVVPILLVVLALTIVGIPLTVLGAVAFAFVAWAAVVYGWFALASWALARVDVENDWAALATGLVVAALVGFVPILGGLATFVVFLLGLGALVLVLNAYRRERRNARRGATVDDDGTTAA